MTSDSSEQADSPPSSKSRGIQEELAYHENRRSDWREELQERRELNDLYMKRIKIPEMRNELDRLVEKAEGERSNRGYLPIAPPPSSCYPSIYNVASLPGISGTTWLPTPTAYTQLLYDWYDKGSAPMVLTDPQPSSYLRVSHRDTEERSAPDLEMKADEPSFDMSMEDTSSTGTKATRKRKRDDSFVGADEDEESNLDWEQRPSTRKRSYRG
jgi:hypothetical protein